MTVKQFIPTIILGVIIAIPFTAFTADEQQLAAKSFAQPALLTSCGQSADVLMLKGLCARAGIDAKYQPYASADSLIDIKSLILVAGASSKGLGAAKVDAGVEEQRVKKLLAAAAKAKLPVVMFHVGADARRGALSDPFNKIAAEGADVIVVAKGGDDDGFFKKIADARKARYIPIENTAGSLIVLNELYPKSKK